MTDKNITTAPYELDAMTLSDEQLSNAMQKLESELSRRTAAMTAEERKWRWERNESIRRFLFADAAVPSKRIQELMNNNVLILDVQCKHRARGDVLEELCDVNVPMDWDLELDLVLTVRRTHV
jgi:hypothetical protein